MYFIICICIALVVVDCDTMAHFSDSEKNQLVKAFESLNVKPDFDDAEALNSWLQNYQGTKPKTDTVSVITQIPKISQFSGDKKDTPCDLWKFEVKCLQEDEKYSEEMIKQAIRKSLKNDPGRIVKRLGTKATISEIIDKLEGIYGDIEQGQDIVAEFYRAKQRGDEDVVTWSCRLESILDRALDQKEIDSSEVEELLRVRFYNGLLEHLRDRSAHKYDQISSFDKLRTAVRQIEHDYNVSHGKPTKVVSQNQMSNVSGQAEIIEIKKTLKDLSGAVKGINAKLQHINQKSSDEPATLPNMVCSQPSSSSANSYPPYVTYGNNVTPSYTRTGFQSSTQYPVASNSSQGHIELQGQTGFGSYPDIQVTHENFRPNNYTLPQHQPVYSQFSNSSSFYGSTPSRFNIANVQCWRCGQYGHRRDTCYVRMDHSNNFNNYRGNLRGSTRRGRP